MLNLLMLSLEETLLQLTKSLIHIGKHACRYEYEAVFILSM